MKYVMRLASIVLAVAVALVSSAEHDAAGSTNDTFDIYLAEQGGSDANSGRTFSDAIRTVRRAHEILHAEDPDLPVRVRVQGGDYYCRGMRGETWDYFNGHPIMITSLNSVPSPAWDSVDDGDRPRFIGLTPEGDPCPYGSVWMGVTHGDAGPGIAVENLRIEKYRGAISLRAHDDGQLDKFRANRIDNNVFLRLGDFYHDAGIAGKGAVLLTRVDGALIEDNYFRHVRNGSGTSGLIHGIYMTRTTSSNKVRNNMFAGSSGVHVKVTHYSNDNVFAGNTFMYAPGGIIDRFCGTRDDDPATDCEDGVPQCPSWGNEVRADNVFHELDMWGVGVYGATSGTSCAYPDPADDVRMVCEGVPKTIYGRSTTDNCFPS